MNETFGGRVKYLMRSLKISREELAEKTGVHRSTISRYLNDEMVPGGVVLLELARALNTTSDYLIGNYIDNSVPEIDYEITVDFVSKHVNDWSWEMKKKLIDILEI